MPSQKQSFGISLLDWSDERLHEASWKKAKMLYSGICHLCQQKNPWWAITASRYLETQTTNSTHSTIGGFPPNGYKIGRADKLTTLLY